MVKGGGEHTRQEDKNGSITVLLVNVGHQLLQQVKVDAVLIQACYVALGAAAVLAQGFLAEVGIQGGFQGVSGVITPPSLQSCKHTFIESRVSIKDQLPHARAPSQLKSRAAH